MQGTENYFIIWLRDRRENYLNYEPGRAGAGAEGGIRSESIPVPGSARKNSGGTIKNGCSTLRWIVELRPRDRCLCHASFIPSRRVKKERNLHIFSRHFAPSDSGPKKLMSIMAGRESNVLSPSFRGERGVDSRRRHGRRTDEVRRFRGRKFS